MKTLAITGFLVALLLQDGSAVAKTPPQAAMKDDSIPTATVENGGLAMKAEFRFEPARRELRIRYLLTNRGKVAVALFDRGDSATVAQGKLKAGVVATPVSESTADGLVLSHRAVAGPATSLVARVNAGAKLGGDVLADTAGATRVRYCLGVANFDKAAYSAPQSVDGVDLWQAPVDVAVGERMLCTRMVRPREARVRSALIGAVASATASTIAAPAR